MFFFILPVRKALGLGQLEVKSDHAVSLSVRRLAVVELYKLITS